MNKSGFIVFIFLGLILNASGMYISDMLIPNKLLHPSAIGFIAGVAAVCLSDFMGEVIE